MPIDYRLYPENWFTEIRPRILIRAGERRDLHGRIFIQAKCEWCKATNHMLHPRTGSMVVLTIAHIYHDKENHAVTDDALAALCQACHLGHDREHHNHVRRMHRHAYGNTAQLTFE
jgi:hypothetical protein